MVFLTTLDRSVTIYGICVPFYVHRRSGSSCSRALGGLLSLRHEKGTAVLATRIRARDAGRPERPGAADGLQGVRRIPLPAWSWPTRKSNAGIVKPSTGPWRRDRLVQRLGLVDSVLAGRSSGW